MDLHRMNVAVIKATFLKMDKQTFIESAKFVKQTIMELEITPKNANYRYKLLVVYKWCRTTYPKKFGKGGFDGFINQLKTK